MFHRVLDGILRLADGGHAQQHITALLHRHLVFLIQHMGVVIQAVHLAVGQRILSHIVRRVGEGPLNGIRQMEDGIHHAFHQLRAVFQVQRHGGIGEIHCADAAVAVALFGEEFQLSVHHNQLVGGDTLPVSHGQDIVIFSADLFGFGPKLLVEGGSPGVDLLVITDGGVQSFLKGGAVGFPISVRILSEILDGFQIVVGQADHALRRIFRGNRVLPHILVFIH